MAEPKKQNYLHGATILAAGVIIMKILGAIYKIPLGNILGDDGYAHFLTAYNIYNVFLTIATAGLPVALSRLISEANTLNRPMQIRRTFNVAFLTFLVLGAISTLLMYIFPNELANAIEDIEAAQSIWALSPAVLLVCLTSTYRGYCQGFGNMTPTTVGQVLEVLVKVAVGLVLALILTKAGKSLPVCSAGAIFGVTVGSLAALVYMVMYKRRYYPKSAISDPDVPDSSGKIFGSLMKVGIPITIGSSVLSLITLIDTKLVWSRLQGAAGFSYSITKTLYGVYGKAQTLYNLPAAFITPLTISVVPAIAALIVKRQRKEAAIIAESSLRIATVIALPMAVGLSVLAYPIVNVLYPNSHEAGPQLLALLGIASYFVCMALMSNAILQASGNEIYPVVSMLAGGIVKIAVNWILVGNPDINIVGAPVGTICCYVVMCALNYFFMSKCLYRRPKLTRVLVTPAMSCAVMGAAAWAVYGLLSKIMSRGGMLGRVPMALSMLVAIGVAAVLYLVMIIFTRSITMDDMKLIPKGEKIGRLLHIK